MKNDECVEQLSDYISPQGFFCMKSVIDLRYCTLYPAVGKYVYWFFNEKKVQRK
jgi:hypothetical protein